MRAVPVVALLWLVPASSAAQSDDAAGGPAMGGAAPLGELGTPTGGIDVPPDPQEGIDGAVEYHGDDADQGGLVGVGALGDPADEAPETPDGELANLPPYQGVIPGSRENADPFDGYEPGPDRVFIQLSRPVEYALSRGPKGQLFIDLPDTSIATTNNARPLDLSFFDTAVAGVRARRLSRQGIVRVVITLKEHTAYRLERRGRYIYVYFRG